MSSIQDRLFLITQLVKVTEKEARYLTRTANRLNELNINLSWVESLDNNDLHSEMLDAFVSRYGRLQDTLGDKLLPAMLRGSLEKTGSQLDNLLRAEKLGWIESTQIWIEIRELRNRLVHEYIESPSNLLSALQQALTCVTILIETQDRMANYVKTIEQI
jgi:HPt (histidine-containing phosphotransfer) domain-containing protein